MSANVNDIHSLKVSGAWAQVSLINGNMQLEYKAGNVKNVPIDNISAVVHHELGAMIQFHKPNQVTNRSDKPKKSVVVTCRTNHDVKAFCNALASPGILIICADDCESLQAADSTMLYIHPKCIAWMKDTACGIHIFADMRMVVLQRISGGSSTFDMAFISEHDMHTVEYIPHSYMENMVNLVPKHIHKYTSGADPIQHRYIEQMLANEGLQAVLDYAPEAWTPLDEYSDDDSMSESDVSEYVPKEDGGSGSDMESSSCDEEEDESD